MQRAASRSDRQPVMVRFVPGRREARSISTRNGAPVSTPGGVGMRNGRMGRRRQRTTEGTEGRHDGWHDPYSTLTWHCRQALLLRWPRFGVVGHRPSLQRVHPGGWCSGQWMAASFSSNVKCQCCGGGCGGCNTPLLLHCASTVRRPHADVPHGLKLKIGVRKQD